ncbi:MAG: hypothetical protein VX640_03440 [Pseudomonadota bacterium]|nr:hypothetical protein [Pseudomonadota bacterium]
MSVATEESRFDAGWRRPAPMARAFAKLLYTWRSPGWSLSFALLFSLPFIVAAMLAPALLSLAPTADLIAPIADARAVAGGASALKNEATPFYALLLLAADLFAEAPGRIHLVAKAFAAALVAGPLAYFSAARFPAAMTALLAAAFAAYIAAPFSGPAELALAVFLAGAVCFACAPADESAARARIEGAFGGALLAALWLLSPVFSLAGFVALSACPFLTGRAGLVRYAGALAMFAALAGFCELLSPGINLVRAGAASGLFSNGLSIAGESATALGGVAAATAVIIFCAAVFGGVEHARGWGAGLALVIVAFIAARLAGANPAPVFLAGAAFAAFSVSSPFYDGVFRDHDRASAALAAAAASLTLFWTAALAAHGAGQLMLQQRAAEEAPANIRAELALVQPGGPTIAKWVEEGRFSTPEARELFALAPVDQSAMLLEAAARARKLAGQGVDVAILTGADAACVIADKRRCLADGAAAAGAANVVFVPRLDLDPATSAAKGRSEALLYTEFRLAEQTPLWDVWVRRGASLPAEIGVKLSAAIE